MLAEMDPVWVLNPADKADSAVDNVDSVVQARRVPTKRFEARHLVRADQAHALLRWRTMAVPECSLRCLLARASNPMCCEGFLEVLVQAFAPAIIAAAQTFNRFTANPELIRDHHEVSPRSCSRDSTRSIRTATATSANKNSPARSNNVKETKTDHRMIFVQKDASSVRP